MYGVLRTSDDSFIYIKGTEDASMETKTPREGLNQAIVAFLQQIKQLNIPTKMLYEIASNLNVRPTELASL